MFLKLLFATNAEEQTMEALPVFVTDFFFFLVIEEDKIYFTV